MTAAPQRGRRRAESVRRQSLFGLGSVHTARTGTHSAASPVSKTAVSKTAKGMAAAAVIAALVAGGAIAQQASPTEQPSLASVVSSAQTSAAPSISASADATISATDPAVTPSATATPSVAAPSSELKAAAAEVTPVAPETSEPAPVAPAVAVDDPAAAKAYAATQVSARGWGAGEMSCLTQLWERESNWRTSALNPDGGAYGIVQSLPAEKMASVGADYLTNYETQITWGLNYITETYSTPCGAWAHSNAVNWY